MSAWSGQVRVDIQLISWNAFCYSQLRRLTGSNLLTFFLHISFDILSDISSDISSDILSDITFDISADILSDIFLTYLLTFLSAISSDSLSDISFDILSDISSDILSDISFAGSFWHIFCHSFWRNFWHITWGPARHTELTGSRLRSATLNSQDRGWGPTRHIELTGSRCRSGTPHWTHRIAVWGPARHTELTRSWLRSGTPHCTHKIVVEVRHITWTQQRDNEVQWEEEEKKEEAVCSHKSNNPHLTGGEKTKHTAKMCPLWPWCFYNSLNQHSTTTQEEHHIPIFAGRCYRDGQNIHTLRKRLAWHPRSQMSMLNNMCVTWHVGGIWFLLSTSRNPL